MSDLPDLATDARAVRAIKRPIPVRVEFAVADGVCQTLEGLVSYRRGDAVFTGIAGESWPVSRERFEQRYVATDGTMPGGDGAYIKRHMEVFALRLEAAIEVPKAGGGCLYGNPGDWLLQYAPDDYGIINDGIFRETYDLI